MKTVLFFFLGSLMLFAGTGCLKGGNDSCTPKTVESEEPAIMDYVAANNITATRHSSGLYYEILSQGTGATPTTTSKVFVTYIGKLLDGTVFDEQTDSSKTGWTLDQLIPGWQIGLPLIKEGGTIKLVIPSSLGYGCLSPSSKVPPNSILYFEVSLVDVQ